MATATTPLLRLADTLVGPHGVDRYLELVRPTWTLREARARVASVDRGVPGAVTLRLRPNAAWKGHRAGQFVRLAVEIDGVRHERCYSPAGPEGDRGAIELTVRTHADGLVSRHLADHAQPGLVVGLSQADGDFVLPRPRPDRLLLISGGSGITPVLSMLRTLCAEGHRGDVLFLHFSPAPERTLHRAELDAIAAAHPNVTVALRHTRAGDGHLTAADLPGRLAAAPAYVCGPPALLDAARTLIEPQRLHVESFLPPVWTVPAGEADGHLRFTASGAQAQNSGAPILVQAEAAGLTPAHGCRMGICHSCTCRKTTGSVRNVLTDEISSAPDEDVQICVTVPLGDVAIDL
ncbi:MAG TPA: ferredoxin reductase [Baekduia sp.]|nr:ferredoxin reductase [Baekduia sp.]